MTPKNKTPTSVETLAGASRFQQSKTILAQAAHRFYAIFCMRCLCLGDVLPWLLAVAVLIGLEIAK
jgi:hypothetical protein